MIERDAITGEILVDPGKPNLDAPVTPAELVELWAYARGRAAALGVPWPEPKK